MQIEKKIVLLLHLFNIFPCLGEGTIVKSLSQVKCVKKKKDSSKLNFGTSMGHSVQTELTSKEISLLTITQQSDLFLLNLRSP